MLFSPRSCNFVAALMCFAAIALAYFYFERELFLMPCPICYAQRFIFGFLGTFFLIAALFPGSPIARRVQGLWLSLLAAGGAALSIRHLYIQNLPEGTVTNCGQDFYGLVKNTPLSGIIKSMVFGNGECSQIQWTLLGLSIPGWTLVAFIGLAIWAIWNNMIRANH